MACRVFPYIFVLLLCACNTEKTPAKQNCEPSCQGSRPVCDEASKRCVECLQNTDCSHTEASVCSAEHTCQPCTANEECAHLELALCDVEHALSVRLRPKSSNAGTNPAILQLSHARRLIRTRCQPAAPAWPIVNAMRPITFAYPWYLWARATDWLKGIV